MFNIQDDKAVGIVNDWDMATRLNSANQVPRSSAHHRTGTLPFMAVDLLRPSPPGHCYRHDLESFFYVLLWAAVSYDLKENCYVEPARSLFGKWLSDDMEDVFLFKTSLFSQWREVMGLVREEWEPIKPWLRKLREPLFRLYTKRTELSTDEEELTLANMQEMESMFTFEIFMKAVDDAEAQGDEKGKGVGISG